MSSLPVRGIRVSRRSAHLLIAILLMSLAVLSQPLQTPLSVHAQTAFQNVISYRVTGAVNFTAPGGESFWGAIPWTAIPLAASVSPGGGHTTRLFLKSANNGFDIYLLFRWNDTQGPSYVSDTEVYRASNGSLVPLMPEATASVKQLFYNSTYFYPDRAAMLWFIANSTSRQQSPVMELGSNGAITGGAADIWHWQSNPTDNNRNDTGFLGGYTNVIGTPISPPDNLSFAEDDYTNTTGFFVTAGSFGKAAPNLDPYANPFVVLAGSRYSLAAKTWTLEMTRSLMVPDAARFRVQLVPNSTYYVASAVWQGKLGESSSFKSVSQWYSITVSDAPPNAISVPQSSGGVTPLLAGVVAGATLIVGVLIGTLLRRHSKEPQN